MRTPRFSLSGILVAACCVGLGFAFLQSSAVDPAVHHEFAVRLQQLELGDTRLNQDVLRARQGIVGHYDGIVDELDRLRRTRQELSEPPAFIGPEGREAYRQAFGQYQATAHQKALLAERFKSTNAALRNSLVYFPIATHDLLQAAASDPAVVEPFEALRVSVLQFVNSHSQADRKRASAALARVSGLRAESAETRRLIDNSRVHARNILERRPQLDLLTDQIVEAPTTKQVRELRASFEDAALQARETAHDYRTLLYLCSVLLMGSIAWAFSAVAEARRRLESANLDLDRRVRERTAELEELNVELETSRKSQIELRDRFLSHVSHELRTPLAAIKQFVDLVLDGIGGEVNEEHRSYLELAAKNVKQLEAMIADLMEVTRAQSGKLRVEVRRMELAPLVSELVQAFESRGAEQGVELSMSLPDELPPILADQTRLRQVFNNLIENALKFTEAGNRIEIRAAPEVGDEARVRISVSDTGCGIPQDQCARIFDRLHQVSIEDSMTRKGLGLGLSICRELITRMNGRIHAESEIGRGSTFHVSLPVYSMADLLRPALLDGSRLRTHLGVLRIHIGSGADAAVTSARRWVKEKVRQTLRTEADVVLPTARDEDLFLVAGCDETGLAALGERIQVMLGGDEALGGRSVDIRARYEAVPSDLLDHGETALGDVARTIERLVEDPAAWAA